jgi:hypothetical protein
MNRTVSVPTKRSTGLITIRNWRVAQTDTEFYRYFIDPNRQVIATSQFVGSNLSTVIKSDLSSFDYVIINDVTTGRLSPQSI